VTVSVCGMSEEDSSNVLICEYDIRNDELSEKMIIRIIPTINVPENIPPLEGNFFLIMNNKK
jgi:hypothetical protein